jgi:hypothetical protein
MAGRWTEGFETHIQTTQMDRKYASRTGSFASASGRVFGTAGSLSAPVYVTPSLGLADTWGVAFALNLLAQVADLNTDAEGFYFEKVAGTEQVHIEFVNNAGSFEIKVMRGATQLSITTETFVYNAWHHFEFKVTVHPSTGAFELRHNEVNVLSATGQNTANDGTSQADVFAARFETVSTNAIFDDICVWNGTGSTNNNFIGDSVVEAVEVNGAGATTQWTPSAGSNFDNVNDPGTSAPDDAGAGGFNGSDTAAQLDLYACTDLTQIQGNILWVQLDTQLAMATAGSRSVDTKYRDPDTTVVDIATHAVTLTTYDSFFDVMDVNPNSLTTWDVADINGGQFGVEVA